MSEDKEQNRNASRKVEAEQDSRKAIDISNSGIYHEITMSSWERCNPSSMQ